MNDAYKYMNSSFSRDIPLLKKLDIIIFSITYISGLIYVLILTLTHKSIVMPPHDDPLNRFMLHLQGVLMYLSMAFFPLLISSALLARVILFVLKIFIRDKA